MLSVARTFNVELIDSILRSPSIYADMCDDKCPKNPMSITVCHMIDALVFLLVKDDEVPVGCFVFEPHETKFAVHTALLPSCRGRNAIKAGNLALDWVFNNTECKEVSSYSFSDSPHVAWFAKMVGLNPIGIESYPNPRNGKPVTITKFLISKAQFRK